MSTITSMTDLQMAEGMARSSTTITIPRKTMPAKAPRVISISLDVELTWTPVAER